MLPSSPNIKSSSVKGNKYNLTHRESTNFENNNFNNINKNQLKSLHNIPGSENIQFSDSKFQMNLHNISKNYDDYITSLASNSNICSSSTQNIPYSQKHINLIQNPIELNPDKFNNLNNRFSRMNEINNLKISQEHIVDVIKYFI